jgi:hypothetical protein
VEALHILDGLAGGMAEVAAFGDRVALMRQDRPEGVDGFAGVALADRDAC